MQTEPTELEMLLQDERLLQEETDFEENNLVDLHQLMRDTKKAIEREKRIVA